MSTAESFISVIEQYFGESMFLAAFFLALVFFYKKSEKSEKKSLLFAVIGAACFFNPIAFRVICALGEQETYYRLLWMIPILMGVGYFCIELLELAEKKYQKCLLIGIMTVLFVLNGNTVLANFMKLPTNIYQMDEDVIQLADAMDELSDGERVDFLSNGNVEDLIRQYNANICLYMNGTHEVNLMLVNEWTHYGGAYVRQKIAYLHPEYIAIKKETPNIVHFLTSSGIKIGAESNNYYLFEVKPDEIASDNSYLESLAKETVTAVNVEYMDLPNFESEYEFLYVTNLFSNYEQQRVEDIIAISKEAGVDAVIINDEMLPNEMSLEECEAYLKETDIPFVYNQSGQNVLEFSELLIYTAQNIDGDISKADFELVKKALETQKSVLLVTDKLINVDSGQTFEGQLAELVLENETVLQNYARGEQWQKIMLQNGVYGFEQNAEHTHMVTLVRVH